MLCLFGGHYRFLINEALVVAWFSFFFMDVSLVLTVFESINIIYYYTIQLNIQTNLTNLLRRSRSKMPNKKSNRFNFMLLEAVDEALSTLGESIKKSVYFHLEETYGINRSEIPDKIAEFSDALEKMFGLGSRYLEILVMKQFYPKIQITCDWPKPDCIIPDLSFKEYIELMRGEFIKQAVKTRMEFFINDYSNKECVAELNRECV